jgi:TonB family protein
MSLRQKRRARSALRRLGAMVLAVTFVLALAGWAAEERAIKSRVAPIYPEIAKRMRISGAVKLEVTVDTEGKVTDVKQLSGNRMLSQAAEDAVRKWKFAAAAVPSVVELELNFDLGH